MNLTEIQEGWRKRPGARFLQCPIIAVKMLNSAEIEITIHCPICRAEGTVRAPLDGIKMWLKGAFIQDVLPDLTPDERERLISGACCL